MSGKKLITLQQAIAVRDAIKPGLVKGVGKPVPGQMCVEAAVCYALGQPHGDDPECVAPSVRAFKIALNDSDWPSEQARADGLMEIGIAQLGTRGEIDEKEFAKKLAELTIRRILPISLRALAAIPFFAGEHAEKLNACADFCEKEGSEAAARSAARSAESAARSAAWSAESAAESAESAAWSAAEAAARSAAESAWSAAWSAESAARSAAWSAESAAESAEAAARSAESARSAARSAEAAARSARSAARSAEAAARSAEAAAWSAESAAWSAWSAAWSAEAEKKHGILKLAASIGAEALRHVKARGVELLDEITKEGL